jgi:hypothetical protein
MSDTPRPARVMAEIKDLIAFYERRGANWLLAAEYTLRVANGSWPHNCYGGKRNGRN